MQIFVVLLIAGIIAYVASTAEAKGYPSGAPELKPPVSAEKQHDTEYIQNVIKAYEKGNATPEMLDKAGKLAAKYGYTFIP